MQTFKQDGVYLFYQLALIGAFTVRSTQLTVGHIIGSFQRFTCASSDRQGGQIIREVLGALYPDEFGRFQRQKAIS